MQAISDNARAFALPSRSSPSLLHRYPDPSPVACSTIYSLGDFIACLNDVYVNAWAYNGPHGDGYLGEWKACVLRHWPT